MSDLHTLDSRDLATGKGGTACQPVSVPPLPIFILPLTPSLKEHTQAPMFEPLLQALDTREWPHEKTLRVRRYV